MRRLAATLIISSRCSVPLFGEVCKVNRELFKTDGVVTAIGGVDVEVSGLNINPNWYAGGYIAWQDADFNIENSRDIESSTAGNLVLISQPLGLSVGTAVKVYPGCNHEWAGDCLTKFNNTINCPAFIGMNGRNPFAGYSVF